MRGITFVLDFGFYFREILHEYTIKNGSAEEVPRDFATLAQLDKPSSDDVYDVVLLLQHEIFGDFPVVY